MKFRVTAIKASNILASQVFPVEKDGDLEQAISGVIAGLRKHGVSIDMLSINIEQCL